MCFLFLTFPCLNSYAFFFFPMLRDYGDPFAHDSIDFSFDT